MINIITTNGMIPQKQDKKQMANGLTKTAERILQGPKKLLLRGVAVATLLTSFDAKAAPSAMSGHSTTKTEYTVKKAQKSKRLPRIPKVRLSKEEKKRIKDEVAANKASLQHHIVVTKADLPAAVPGAKAVHRYNLSKLQLVVDYGTNPSKYDHFFEASAKRWNIEPERLKAWLGAESDLHPDNASGTGPLGMGMIAGITGLTTGLILTDDATGKVISDFRTDPQSSIDGAAMYISRCLTMANGDYAKAVQLYYSFASTDDARMYSRNIMAAFDAMKLAKKSENFRIVLNKDRMLHVLNDEEGARYRNASAKERRAITGTSAVDYIAALRTAPEMLPAQNAENDIYLAGSTKESDVKTIALEFVAPPVLNGLGMMGASQKITVPPIAMDPVETNHVAAVDNTGTLPQLMMNDRAAGPDVVLRDQAYNGAIFARAELKDAFHATVVDTMPTESAFDRTALIDQMRANRQDTTSLLDAYRSTQRFYQERYAYLQQPSHRMAA